MFCEKCKKTESNSSEPNIIVWSNFMIKRTQKLYHTYRLNAISILAKLIEIVIIWKEKN